jgi:hypothetical protein
MNEQISEESGRVLLLKIQDEGDVSLGVKILKGELACKYDTIQLCVNGVFLKKWEVTRAIETN